MDHCYSCMSEMNGNVSVVLAGTEHGEGVVMVKAETITTGLSCLRGSPVFHAYNKAARPISDPRKRPHFFHAGHYMVTMKKSRYA